MARPSKIHPHRGKWRFRIAGKEYEFETERQAKAQFHILMGRHLAETGNTDRPHTVAGAVEKWLALNGAERYGQWLAPFLEFAGRVYLDDVGRDLLTRYHVHLKGQKAKRATYDKKTKTWTAEPTDKPLAAETIRHYIRAATAVLKWAEAQGWADCVPILPKLPKPFKRARDVQPARLSEILDSLPDRAGHVLRFIAFTGARPSEALRLEWRQVNLDARVCTLDEHKTADDTGEPRTLYLTDQALVILQALKPDEPEGHVFTSRLGKPYTVAGLRAILKRHGGITPYQLRHSFAQMVSDSGKTSLEDLSRLMGHTGTKMTEHYFRVRDARAVKAAKRIKLKIA